MKCTTHHPACACREQKIALLDKCAKAAATELVALSARFHDQIDAFSLAHIKAVVERTYDSSEQLQPPDESKKAKP